MALGDSSCCFIFLLRQSERILLNLNPFFSFFYGYYFYSFIMLPESQSLSIYLIEHCPIFFRSNWKFVLNRELFLNLEEIRNHKSPDTLKFQLATDRPRNLLFIIRVSENQLFRFPAWILQRWVLYSPLLSCPFFLFWINALTKRRGFWSGWSSSTKRTSWIISRTCFFCRISPLSRASTMWSSGTYANRRKNPVMENGKKHGPRNLH